MNMLHLVNDPCRIVQVLGHRLTILTLDGIDDMHRRTCRPEIGTTAAEVKVVARVLRMQGNVLCTLR